MRLYATILLAGLAALALVLLGVWWAPFVAGLVVGAVISRARAAIPTAAAIGLLSWLIPLVAVHARYGLGPTANAIAAIMGFDHQPAVPLVLTLLVGALLGTTGGWLVSAARSLTPTRTGDSFRRTDQASR